MSDVSISKFGAIFSNEFTQRRHNSTYCATFRITYFQFFIAKILNSLRAYFTPMIINLLFQNESNFTQIETAIKGLHYTKSIQCNIFQHKGLYHRSLCVVVWSNLSKFKQFSRLVLSHEVNKLCCV